MNVLISSVSRKVSLVRSFRATGAKVIVGDMNANCPGMYEGDDAVEFPALDSESFKPLLKSVCRTFDIGLVVPTRDDEVLAFSEWKDEFKELGVRLLAPSTETVKLCQDKIEFSCWCVANGYQVAPIYGPHDLAFPAFMRSRRGKGSAAAVRVTHMDEFKYHFKRFDGDVLIQEFIRAPEYSVDVFADESGRVISAVPRQRVQIVGGESWNTMTVENKPLQDDTVRLAQDLKLTGHAVMQCFIHEGKVLWIEVNPRFGGASALAFEAGCNSPAWLTGTPMPDEIPSYTVGLRMLRYTQDRFVRTA